jgi:replicative DNA helicase
MADFNPYAGMKPDVSESDRQLVRWMFSQPPFNRKPYKVYNPEAENRFINAVIKTGTLPPSTKETDFIHPANRQIIRACLVVQKKGLPLTLQNIGEQLRFEEYGPYYSEMTLLSCLLAGGEIPATVNESVFSDPRNRIIFRAVKRLETLGAVNFHCLVGFLTEFSMVQKCGGMTYLEKIESVMPVACAVNALTTALLTKAVLQEAA